MLLVDIKCPKLYNTPMSRNKCLLILALVLTLPILSKPLLACDDTLVMLLTAKDPTSEFSKSIRNFMTSLTQLGTSLKYNPKEDYSKEVNTALEAWLSFSQKYMTNSPEEAKNDLNWREKMSATARKIGDIRKLVNNKEYTKAHNAVLELSNTIGTFFEAVGISDEKQVFIATSANINDLQRFIDQKQIKEALDKLGKIKENLESFKKSLSKDDLSVAINTSSLIDTMEATLNNKPEELSGLDDKVNKLRTSFEDLRSRILMEEWFSNEELENKEGK